MSPIFKFAMALESFLLCLHWAFKPAWLPLGGGHAEQVAILFTAAAAVSEALSALHSLKRRRSREGPSLDVGGQCSPPKNDLTAKPAIQADASGPMQR